MELLYPHLCKLFFISKLPYCRFWWPSALRRVSAAPRLMGLWVRIPPEAWMSVSCDCCVLSGRGLCIGLINRPDGSYRVWWVCVWKWVWSGKTI